MRQAKSERTFRGIFCLALCLFLALGPLTAGCEDTEPAEKSTAAETPAADKPAAGEPSAPDQPVTAIDSGNSGGDPAPEEPRQNDPAPADPTPDEPVPNSTGQNDPAPGEPSSNDPAPADSGQNDPVPADPASGEPASGEPAPGGSSSEEPVDSEPSPSPSPTPTPAPPRLVITVEGAREDEKTHIWHLALNAGDPLRLRWATDGKADSFQLVFSGGGTTERKEGNVVTAELDTTDYQSGTYTVRVTASLRGQVRVTAELTLVLTVRRPGPTGETPVTPTPSPTPHGATPTPSPTPGDATPSPTPGSEETPGSDVTPTPGNVSPTPRRPNFPSRRRKGTGSSVFVITPGKALISTHAKGTGDMTAYGTVALDIDEENMTILSMGGQALEVSRGGDAVFHASLENGKLTLTADEGDAWYFTQYALQVLSRSGVTEIILDAPDGEAEIPTDLALTGAAYGRERAGGFVASDFLYAYSSDLLTVQVEDRLYAINDGIMVSIDID